MIIMPANNSMAYRLEEKYPGRMGLLMSPPGWRQPKGLQYALDNDRYSVWSKGKTWDEAAYLRMIDRAVTSDYMPMWIAVPDCVGDAVATFKEWEKWAPRLHRGDGPRPFDLALVVQDGMTPDAVRKYAWPDVIFIGGTVRWKRATTWNWCREFPRVHVGRVNTERWLWHAARCGAESCDGTGWFRGDKAQLRGLLRYLRLSSQGIGPAQLELAYSRFGPA